MVLATESLADHVRRATRNFTARLPEERALILALDLARELARAHAEAPPRHPEIEPSSIEIIDGRPRLVGGSTTGDAGEDLFALGALVYWLVTGVSPDISWHLDGPPMPEVSTLLRRATVALMASPRREARFPTAAATFHALGVAHSPPKARPPWGAFRGDAGRTGARPDLPTPGKLEAAWEARLGRVAASPVLTSTLAIVPAADGRLTFVDRVTGRIFHEMRLASAIESTPAVSDDATRLYVGTDDGALVAVDLVEGKEQFRAQVGSLVRSSPLILEDRVLVGVVEGKDTGSIVALDTAGKVVWRRKLGAVFSSPAAGGSSVLVGSDNGSLHALDPAKGTLLWSQPLGAKVRATPAVAGQVALVGDFGGRLVAVNVADGRPTWTQELGHALYSSACVSGGLAVVGCHEGHVHGVDRVTGENRLEVTTRGPVVSSPVGIGGAFAVGSTDGTLYLLDATGRVLQQVAVSTAGIESSPAVDGNLVVVGSAAGLHAFNAT